MRNSSYYQMIDYMKSSSRFRQLTNIECGSVSSLFLCLIIVSVLEKGTEPLLVKLIVHLHALGSIVFKQQQQLLRKFEHS